MSGKKTTNKITAKGTKGGNRISEGGTSRAAGEGSGAETLAMARVRAPPGTHEKSDDPASPGASYWQNQSHNRNSGMASSKETMN